MNKFMHNAPVCVDVCTYVCTYAYLCASMWACMYMRGGVDHIHACPYSYTYDMRMCLCVSRCACTHIGMDGLMDDLTYVSNDVMRTSVNACIFACALTRMRLLCVVCLFAPAYYVCVCSC